MKTNTSPTHSSNAHTSQPSFSRKAEGTFFSQEQTPAQPFFSPQMHPPSVDTGSPNEAEGTDGVEIQRKEMSSPPARRESLPGHVSGRMQSLFGQDFSRVQIQRDDATVASMGASAVTQGEGIRFAPGQYRPDHPRGLKLIGHELAHVAQQRLGSGGPIQLNRDPLAEEEAELASERVGQNQPVSIQRAAFGIQPRMGFEFQGSNTIEYGYNLASGSPRWEPAPRKSAEFHGHTGPPHVKLESDSRGDFEFVTHPYASARGLLAEVAQAAQLTRHILSWSRFSSEPNHVRLAQRGHGSGSGEQRRIHRGRSWATMSQVNSQKGGRPADAVRMHIEDASFSANPQVTEGVRLEEIEGFFRQNLGNNEPVPERADTIQSYIDPSVSDPSLSGAFGSLSPLDRARVRGFLSMVTALFLYARRYEPGNPVIKESFSILHRTRVSSMFAYLSGAARAFVQQHAFRAGSIFLSELGTNRDERIFPQGYDTQGSVRRRSARGQAAQGGPVRGGFRGPTVGQWFDSIIRPRRGRGDLMSPIQHGTRSMGQFGMDTAPDGTDSLVVLEVRNWGSRLQQGYRQEFTRQYREHMARQAELRQQAQQRGRMYFEEPPEWEPGDPVPNSIPATTWEAFARFRVQNARDAGRGRNFTP